MSKVYNSAVVIIPPEEKWAPIQEIRKKYDRQINRWMPHITIIYPFRPEAEYLKVERDFSNICKYIAPFEIHLEQLNYFPHGRQKFTLWLNPEPVHLIKSLQTRILEIVPDCNDVNKQKNGFRPHMSVGQIHGEKNLLKIINYLQDNWCKIHFLLTEIFFISREKSKTSKFEIKKRIQLKKE